MTVKLNRLLASCAIAGLCFVDNAAAQDAAAATDNGGGGAAAPPQFTPTTTPTSGDWVTYRLRSDQAAEVNKRRTEAYALPGHILEAGGVQLHRGNEAKEGDAFPMLITRVWGAMPGGAVNGQVFLDGNDTVWVTSVSEGVSVGSFSYPVF